MEGEGLSLLVAFAAGFLSFISPCVLPLLPAYIGYLTGTEVAASGAPSRRSGFLHSLSFVVGFSLVFITIGASAGFIGSLASAHMPLLRKITGALLVILGLHLAGVFKLAFLYRELRLNYSPTPSQGFLRSFLVGTLFSLAWTPCAGPILGAIFTLALSSQTVWEGAYLLAAYSLGLGIPFLITGLALNSVMRYLKRLNRFMNIVSIISGLLLIGVGVLVFTNNLTLLSFSG